jgi:hypothetical protein
MASKNLPQDYDPTLFSPIGMEFFCSTNDWCPEIIERVLSVIEEMVPDTRIGWELKFIAKNRKVDGQWIEDFQYKNIDFGEDRVGYVQNLLRKTGQVALWNGELERLVYVRFYCARKKISHFTDFQYVGYSIEVSYFQDILSLDKAFKAIGIASNARYSSQNALPFMVMSQLNTVDSVLRRDRHIDSIKKAYPNYVTAVDELALHLPQLESSTHLAEITAVPRILWMNYWHPETAAFYGFPDPEKDARILPLAEQLPNGAWFFKLTEDPLDITRADHRDALIWAYQRFQPVGQPVEPAEREARAKCDQSLTVEQFREMANQSAENLDPAARKKLEADAQRFFATVEAIKAKQLGKEKPPE